MLNEKEKEYVYNYNKNDAKYTRLFELDAKKRQYFFGDKKCTSEMFKPLKYLYENHVFPYKT
jgi:hypothetical protein